MRMLGLRSTLRVVLVGLTVVLAAGAWVGGGGAAPDDLFTGSWVGTGGPGSTLRISVSAPGPSGIRHVHFSEQGGENAGSGVSCTARGTAAVESKPSSGYDQLSGEWTLRCHGELREGFFQLIRPYALDSMIFGSDSLRRRGGD